MRGVDDLFQALAVILITLLFGYLIDGYFDCTAIGGEYVRGLFLMECIE